MYGNRRFYSALTLAALFFLGACANKDRSAAKKDEPSASAVSALTKLTPVSVASSGNSPADPPANVIDGDLNTAWNSGSAAPQWIQLDLGQEYMVAKVRLNVLQNPAGPTTHHVFGGPTPDNLVLIGILVDISQDHQWLEFQNSVSAIRYLKVETTRSPSWVAWREIEVYK